MIYENVKGLCEEKQISISSLEKQAGIGNGTIGKWNKPKSRPSAETLIKIANALNVSVDRLVKE